MTEEYKELLDNKFEHLLSKMQDNFTIINTKLTSIDEQVKKTNGRVTVVEKDITELEKKEIKHFVNCPQAKKIGEIEDELMEYRVFKKYPKFFIVGFIALIILVLTKDYFLSFF